MRLRTFALGAVVALTAAGSLALKVGLTPPPKASALSEAAARLERELGAQGLRKRSERLLTVGGDYALSVYAPRECAGALFVVMLFRDAEGGELLARLGPEPRYLWRGRARKSFPTLAHFLAGGLDPVVYGLVERGECRLIERLDWRSL